MRTIILALCCLLISACMTAYHRDNNPESWRGKSVQELVKRYGTPIFKSPAPGGDTYYIYLACPISMDHRAICPLKPSSAPFDHLVAYEVDGSGVVLKVKTGINGKNISKKRNNISY